MYSFAMRNKEINGEFHLFDSSSRGGNGTESSPEEIVIVQTRMQILNSHVDRLS